MVRISSALAAQLTGKKKHKYSAQRTRCLHGHDHDSKKEAMWCLKLHQLEKEGKILCLVIQPKFELIVNDIHIADHYPDFGYGTSEVKNVMGLSLNLKKAHVVEVKGDWEGSRLQVWKIKHRLFCALYQDINYQVV